MKREAFKGILISDPQKFYAQRKKQPPRLPSPLLGSKIEGSVVEVKSTTLTESGNIANSMS